MAAITFEVDSTTAEGTFIRVLRDGRPFGKILDAAGLYRFYEADHEKLGSVDSFVTYHAKLTDPRPAPHTVRSSGGEFFSADRFVGLLSEKRFVGHIGVAR